MLPNLPEVGAENRPEPQGGLGTEQKPNIPPAPSSWDDDRRAIAQTFAMVAMGDETGGMEHWMLYRKLKGWN